MKFLVQGRGAEKAYSAFLTFKDVVKKNCCPRRAPRVCAVWRQDQRGRQGLSDASYPFLKNIDWLSNMYTKPLPGTSVTQYLKAVDTTIVMGNARYGNLLKAAAEANHKAIGSIDAKGRDGRIRL